MAKLPVKPSSAKDVNEFLSMAGSLAVKARKVEGRVIFAIDATASRQASWDRACHYQSQMFRAVDDNGGLAVQLSYFHGFDEFYSSSWCFDSQSLLQHMNRVSCVGGYTQIESLLKHAIKENNNQSVNALVYIGDAVEEDLTELTRLSGKLGLLKCPLFIFQEGNDAGAKKAFLSMAKLSGGAYYAFSESSAKELGELLSAVAVFATSGKSALNDSALLSSKAVKVLLQQLS